MGVLTRLIEVPDLHRYKPEFYPDGTEKHVFCEGARYHVLSYSTTGTRCSAPKCEFNLPDEKRFALIVGSAGIAGMGSAPARTVPQGYRVVSLKKLGKLASWIKTDWDRDDMPRALGMIQRLFAELQADTGADGVPSDSKASSTPVTRNGEPR